MTLQSSGQITWQQIQNEFGGSHRFRLAEYYGAATGIPGSGQIAASNFYGKSSFSASGGAKFTLRQLQSITGSQAPAR